MVINLHMQALTEPADRAHPAAKELAGAEVSHMSFGFLNVQLLACIPAGLSVLL